MHKQTLILLKGHPGTGKSTLAAALAQRLHWPLIDKDDIKDHTYTLLQGNELAYKIMWQITGHQLEIGLSLVVDSPLAYPVLYATGQELAASYGARLWVIETTLPEEVWRTRLEARCQEQQPHRITSWDAMQQSLINYADCWRFPIAAQEHLLVDTSEPVDQVVQSIIDHLSSTL